MIAVIALLWYMQARWWPKSFRTYIREQYRKSWWSCSRCHSLDVSIVGPPVCAKVAYCVDHYLIVLSRFDSPRFCRLGAFFVHRLLQYLICLCHFSMRLNIAQCIFIWFKTWKRTDFSIWRDLLTLTVRYFIVVYVAGQNTTYHLIHGRLDFTRSKSLSLNTLNSGHIHLMNSSFARCANLIESWYENVSTAQLCHYDSNGHVFIANVMCVISQL